MSLSVNLPNLTIGVDAFDAIDEYCSQFGTAVAILGGEKALAASKERLTAALEKSSLEVATVQVYGKEASYTNVEKMKAIKEVQDADMIFAVGGGRAIDTIKVVARDLDKPLFTIPTLASVSAPTSSVCVMYHDNHEMAGLAYCKAPAEHTFIDTQIIAEAPVEYLWAGIGDCMSKEVETSFSSRGRDLSFENRLGVNIVKGTNDKLMAVGAKALKAVRNQETNQALEDVVLEIIGASAYASVLVENDINSNMAHAYYYGYTVLPQAHEHLHGEVVSYGILLLLTMDQQFEYRDRMKAFMESIKLPTKLAAQGVTTQEDIDKLVDKAMTMDDLTFAPYTITREKFEQAIRDVEALD